jgi:hypothetical protein
MGGVCFRSSRRRWCSGRRSSTPRSCW